MIDECLQVIPAIRHDDAEWKLIQKNTFTRWVNNHLSKVGESINALVRGIQMKINMLHRMHRKLDKRSELNLVVNLDLSKTIHKSTAEKMCEKRTFLHSLSERINFYY